MDRRIFRWALQMAPQAGPRTAAAARIAVAAAAIFVLPLAWSPSLGTLPAEMWRPPRGTEWLGGWVHVSRGLARMSAVALTVGALGLLVGFKHRWFGLLAASSLLYVGWIHQLSGKTDHYHHVLWFLVIVSIFPTADAWSAESLSARRRGLPAPLRARHTYALPIATMIVAIGLIYFFAGVSKLRLAGLEWVFSDNLRNIMYRTWWEKGMDPIPLVDGALVSRLGAGLTVLFELTFLPLVAFVRTRRYVRYVGLMFHLGTWLVLGISFLSLMIMYVVFFDWPEQVQRVPHISARPRSELHSRFGWAVVVALLFAIAAFGAIGVERSWPIAAYPTFAAEHIASTEILELAVSGDDGINLNLRDSQLAAAYGPSHASNMMFHSLFAAHNGNSGPLLAFVELFEALEGPPFGRIRTIDTVVLDVADGNATVVTSRLVYPVGR